MSRTLPHPGIVAFLLIGWLLVVAVLTLTPQPIVPHLTAPERWCFLCGERGLSDALLNVVMFLPLGLAVGGFGLHWLVAFLAGAAVSVGIEVGQLYLPGRYPTVGDVVSNSTGAGVGGLLWQARTLFLVPRAALPRWAPWTAGVVAGGLALLFGVLQAPRGTDDRYWGQWTADLLYLEAYDGRILDATLVGRPFPSGPFPDEWDDRAIFDGDWVIDAQVSKGSPPVDLAPILSVYDDSQREIGLLGANGDDLVWRERTRAVSLLLDYPALRWSGALASIAQGEIMRIGARRDGRKRCLSVNGSERCDFAFTPGRTWALLLAHPGGLGPRVDRVLDLFWLVGLFAAVGFFARSRDSLLSAGGLAASLIVVATLVTRLVLGPATHAVAAVVGLAVGWVTRSGVSSLAASNLPRSRASPPP